MFLKTAHNIFAHSRASRYPICHSGLSRIFLYNLELICFSKNKHRKDSRQAGMTQRCIKILYLSILCFLFLFYFATPVHAFMSDTEIAVFQKEIAGKPVGDRMALWAEKFVGTPYDPDP